MNIKKLQNNFWELDPWADGWLSEALLSPQLKYNTSFPQCNCYKDENMLVFNFMVPGVEEKEISIEYDPKSKKLIIFKMEEERKEEVKACLLAEYTTRIAFKRSITVPYPVFISEETPIEASLKNGILIVKLPLQQKEENKIIKVW